MPPRLSPRAPPINATKGSPRSPQRELTNGSRAEISLLIDRLFALGDVDANGAIMFGELLALHQKFTGFCEKLEAQDESTLQRNFRSNDMDNNQRLDKQEFSAYMEGVLSVIGVRVFIDVSTRTLEADAQRVKQRDAQFNKVASEQLLEQAQTARCLKTSGMQEAAEKLIESRADVTKVDKRGSSVLHYAVEKADLSLIETLLRARADPSLHDKEWDSAAFKAARLRRFDILEILLMPTGKATDLESEAMNEAREQAGRKLVREMHSLPLGEVRELMRTRADLNHRDDNGWTPLTAAVLFDRRDCVEELIRSQSFFGSAPSKLRLGDRNARGRAALHVAARKGCTEIVPLLVAAKADVDVQDADGWTPLHHAVFNSSDGVIKVLLKSKASMVIQGRNGLTPFMVTRLPQRAGTLSDSTRKLLEPQECVNFGKVLLPLLRADRHPYEKMEALLTLPSVNRNPENLRLYDQCFDMRTGPNKVRLQKLWEGLVLPMIRCLRDGGTGLDPPGPHFSKDESKERLYEISHRQREMKHFVAFWLRDTRGPRRTVDWTHENRAAYGDELRAVLSEELAAFEAEMDSLYERILQEKDGEHLADLPAHEVLDEGRLTQLSAHAIPVWLEELDPAGAFRALRLVGANGMGKDKEESLEAFVDLLATGHDFDTPTRFWQNIYRFWLRSYAQIADADFHRKMSSIVDKFNKAYEAKGHVATYRRAPQKSYESMLRKERNYGARASDAHESYEGRTSAAKLLDIVRGSVTVRSPAAAMALLMEYFRPLKLTEDKAELVCVRNRFSRDRAETLQGYRNIEMNIFWNGGLRAGRGSPTDENDLPLAIIGEVQIVLEDYLAVKKRRHLIYKCMNGHFDWHPDDQFDDLDALAKRESGGLDDDDDC